MGSNVVCGQVPKFKITISCSKLVLAVILSFLG